MIIPVIQCAVCGRPVERCEAWQDYSDLTWKFRVKCHGQTEECALDRIALDDRSEIVDAVAFRQLAVTNGMGKTPRT
jgi:hypothetical protein